MSILETPRLPEARVNPTLMMGAASPLWSYFAAAAASGVAYWWMTRWSRPANLEAFFAAAGPPAVPATPVEVVEIVAEVVAEEPEVQLAATSTAEPVAEIAPVIAAPVIAAPPEPELEAVIEAIPEPIVDMAQGTATNAAAAPTLKLKSRKTASSTPEPEA